MSYKGQSFRARSEIYEFWTIKILFLRAHSKYIMGGGSHMIERKLGEAIME